MISEKDLQELANFSTSDTVLSVFLNTEPAESTSDAHSIRLRNMLKNIDLPADVAAVEDYYHYRYDRSGKGLVIYSCKPRNFFRTYSLPIPVKDMVRTGNMPAIKPLVRLLHVYGSYGVILIDKQGSRLFHFHLGELREQEGNYGESIKQVKQGGASSMPGRRGGTGGQTRAIDEQIERNMKDMVDFAEQFFKENKVRRILIGGTDDNVSHFRGLLPKSWQSLIMGNFPMSMTANHGEVLDKALQVGKDAEKEREHHLLVRLIDNASQANNAVLGLDATLEAINDARVQTLIVSEDFYLQGFACPDCNQLLPQQPNVDCSHCNDHPILVEDIIDLAVSYVIRLGGDVEIIEKSRELEKAGNIGAFLRY